MSRGDGTLGKHLSCAARCTRRERPLGNNKRGSKIKLIGAMRAVKDPEVRGRSNLNVGPGMKTVGEDMVREGGKFAPEPPLPRHLIPGWIWRGRIRGGCLGGKRENPQGFWGVGTGSRS